MFYVYNPDGADDVEKAVVDMLLDAAMDLRNGVVRLCYNKDYVSKNRIKSIKSIVHIVCSSFCAGFNLA